MLSWQWLTASLFTAEGTSGKIGWGNPQTPIPEGQMLAIVPNMLVSQWSSEAMRCLQSNAWNIMIYPNDKNLVQGFWEKFEEQSKSQDHTTLVIMPISVA